MMISAINVENEIAAIVGYRFRDELSEQYYTVLTRQLTPLVELIDYVLERDGKPAR